MIGYTFESRKQCVSLVLGRLVNLKLIKIGVLLDASVASERS